MQKAYCIYCLNSDGSSEASNWSTGVQCCVVVQSKVVARPIKCGRLSSNKRQSRKRQNCILHNLAILRTIWQSVGTPCTWVWGSATFWIIDKVLATGFKHAWSAYQVRRDFRKIRNAGSHRVWELAKVDWVGKDTHNEIPFSLSSSLQTSNIGTHDSTCCYKPL